MMHQEVRLRLTGIAPLLMHNVQLADPSNEWTIAMKKISGKRKKTEADLAELARLEWWGGLYLCDGMACVTDEMLEACAIDGAKKHKLGKVFKAAVFADGPAPLVDYDGPKDVRKREADPACRKYGPVVVSRSRVFRCRPIFRHWTCEPVFLVNDTMVDVAQFAECMQSAGEQCGLGDWRPKFGRFDVEVIQ